MRISLIKKSYAKKIEALKVEMSDVFNEFDSTNLHECEVLRDKYFEKIDVAIGKVVNEEKNLKRHTEDLSGNLHYSALGKDYDHSYLNDFFKTIDKISLEYRKAHEDFGLELHDIKFDLRIQRPHKMSEFVRINELELASKFFSNSYENIEINSSEIYQEGSAIDIFKEKAAKILITGFSQKNINRATNFVSEVVNNLGNIKKNIGLLHKDRIKSEPERYV